MTYTMRNINNCLLVILKVIHLMLCCNQWY